MELSTTTKPVTYLKFDENSNVIPLSDVFKFNQRMELFDRVTFKQFTYQDWYGFIVWLLENKVIQYDNVTDQSAYVKGPEWDNYILSLRNANTI